MKKWPAKLGKALHALVPYVALVLTLHGQPECAAALQAIVGAPLLPPAL